MSFGAAPHTTSAPEPAAGRDTPARFCTTLPASPPRPATSAASSTSMLWWTAAGGGGGGSLWNSPATTIDSPASIDPLASTEYTTVAVPGANVCQIVPWARPGAMIRSSS